MTRIIIDDPWQPIEKAPKDRMILVYCPPREGLDEIVCPCEWHEDAGFCVDEIHSPTHYRFPEPTVEDAAALAVNYTKMRRDLIARRINSINTYPMPRELKRAAKKELRRAFIVR